MGRGLHKGESPRARRGKRGRKKYGGKKTSPLPGRCKNNIKLVRIELEEYQERSRCSEKK